MSVVIERGESLPQPIRDKVIERARFTLKRVETAHQAAEAEVRTRTTGVASGKGSAAALGLLQSLNRFMTNFNVFLGASPQLVVYDETKREQYFVAGAFAPSGFNSTSNHFDQCVVMTTSLSGIQFGKCSKDRIPLPLPS